MMRVIGVIMKNTTFPGERLDLINRKRSCPPTGTRPFPRSVSVWKSDNIFSSLSSTSRLTLCTHWSLMSITVPPHWVVARGRSWLVRRPLYSTTATRKGSMSFVIRRKIYRARIGIVSNNENDCHSCDSRIGFGARGKHDNSNTCGNEAMYSTDNGDKHIKAMGYILVQWERNLSHNTNNLLYRWDDDFSNCEVALLDLDLCQYITGVLPWINLHWAISAHLEKIWDSFV